MRAGNLAAYSHQELPFERLVEVLNPARSLSRHPLFQVMLVLQNNAELGLELSGLSAGFEAVATASAKFDLSLSLAERRGADGSPAGIEGALEYASDLFDRSSVEAIAGRLVRLLEGAVADPERAIGRLDILGADERHTILREWNATARAVPGATLPELFAAQVARTPEADAVVFEDERLSYGELDARSSRLAHHLRALGVGPEVVVGLCIERSLAMLVGLLGILKAGGAYLPLDPDYPPERLAFMLADAGAPVLLTRAALRAHLPAHDAHVVCLDADWPAIARQPATAPVTNLAPQHPAYVIYTSGSTGTPKGVAVTHQNVVNLSSAQIVWAAACWVAGACARERCEPVHGAAGWFERAADASVHCGGGAGGRAPACAGGWSDGCGGVVRCRRTGAGPAAADDPSSCCGWGVVAHPGAGACGGAGPGTYEFIRRTA